MRPSSCLGVSKEYTLKELARILGTSERAVQKKFKSFMKFNNIPPDRVLKKRNGVWKYVVDSDLLEEFMKYITPKIRIKVVIDDNPRF